MSKFPGWRVVVAVTLAAGIAVVCGMVVSDAVALQETGQSEILEVENTSNYLSPSPENTTQQQYQTATVDVSGAVAVDSKRLQGEQLINRYDYRIIQGEDSGTVARDTARTLFVSVESLEQRQDELFSAYSDGEISERTLFREVVRLEATANQYRRLSEHAHSEPTLSSEIQTQYANLDVETTLLPSPVSGKLVSALTGDSEPITVYVQSAEDSLVLATVADGIYQRQATVRSQRVADGQDQFATSDSPEEAAQQRAATLYPWTVTVDLTPEIELFDNSSIYLFRSSHAHGEIRSYLDGRTRNVFHEVQFKNPIQVPVSQVTTNTDNDIRLTVESTAGTGPMRISLVSGDTLDSSEVTISVKGQEVGTLDESGNLWTIQPLESFEVTATTPDGDTVSVQVTVLDS